MSERAEQFIKLQEREESKNSGYRSMCQSTAELMFPRDSAITTTYAPGTPRTETIYDITALEDSKTMADGMLSALIPAGEYFFKLNVSADNPGGVTEEYKSYLDRGTDKLHRSLFASNFMLQMGETLRSLVVFGTGNIFSEWSLRTGGLNFRDYDVGRYTMLENSKGQVDTMILKYSYTARQAVQEWGDKVGKSVSEAYADDKKKNDIFWFIHIVQPREERNVRLTDFMNMPFESVFVAVKDKIIVDEGGFPEFPYHPPRWAKTTGEVHGRGVGTDILPHVRVLQRQMADFQEMGNKYPNPPRDILSTFDGEYNVCAGATNEVTELPGSAVVEFGGPGAFVVTKEIIDLQRDVIHIAFKKRTFTPLTDLTGDRRNELEIRERILEGLRSIGQPAGRTQSELLEPLVRRSFMLLVRNGEIPEPPAGLELVEIEYLGLMANALSSGQSRGFLQAAEIAINASETFPEAKDNLNADEGFRDAFRNLGVKAEHLNTPEQIEAIRAERLKQQQIQQALEATKVAAQGYNQTSQKAEDGSPAAQIQEAVNA